MRFVQNNNFVPLVSVSCIDFSEVSVRSALAIEMNIVYIFVFLLRRKQFLLLQIAGRVLVIGGGSAGHRIGLFGNHHEGNVDPLARARRTREFGRPILVC